jgi:hypothetical protein
MTFLVMLGSSAQSEAEILAEAMIEPFSCSKFRIQHSGGRAASASISIERNALLPKETRRY